MGIPNAITWPRRRARCLRRGHKWYAADSGGHRIEYCVRCGKRVVLERIWAPPDPPPRDAQRPTPGQPPVKAPR